MRHIITGNELVSNEPFYQVMGIAFILFGCMVFIGSVISWTIGWFFIGIVLFGIGIAHMVYIA